MSRPRRIAFVVSYSFHTVIGGHLLSAVGIAKKLAAEGYEICLIADVPDRLLCDLRCDDIEVHRVRWGLDCSGYGRWALAHVARSLRVFLIARTCDVVVAMDILAMLHIMPAVAFCNRIPVQVVAGGPGRSRPPLCFPGTVVFSDELYRGFPEWYHIPQEHLILSRGRVDFSELAHRTKDLREAHSLGFLDSSPKILTVSRLVKSKDAAILALLNEVSACGELQPLQLIVVGDGSSRAMLQRYAEDVMRDTEGRVKVIFLGAFRVFPADLVQADLVIGQGRTVIEALACGVPVAVCGSNGYKGLVTTETLPILCQTNLTGRSTDRISSLRDDLAILPQYRNAELRRVTQLARSIYDSHLGAKAFKEAWRLVEQTFPGAARRRLGLWVAYGRYLHQWVLRLLARGKHTRRGRICEGS